MARKILVADRDPVYAQALMRRIQRHSPTCEVMAVSDEQAFQEQLARAAGDLSLVVSAAHFPVDSLPAGVSQLILLETRIGPEDQTAPTRPVRLGSVRPILERLDLGERAAKPAESQECQEPAAEGPASMPERRTPPLNRADLSDGGSADPAEANYPLGVPMAKPSPERPRRIILILTQTIDGRQPTYADQRCQSLAQDGERIFYLPLMPVIYCRQAPASVPGSGPASSPGSSAPGLTDLLLRADCGGLKPADLGAYMAADRLGRMQIRPTDRADDLFDCRPHTLFQLVTLLRERVLGESGSRLVVEAAGIPFRSIQAILPLFEAVEVILPDDSGFAGQALRREIGDLLTALADGARLVQVPEPGLRQIAMPGKPTLAGSERAVHVPA